MSEFGKKFAFLILFPVWLSAVHSNHCANFTFPTLKPETFKFDVKENTFVKLPFILNTGKCSDLDNFKIKVASYNKARRAEADYCSILHENGQCIIPVGQAGCTCPTGTDNKYYFIKEIEHADNTEWKWYTMPGVAEEGKLQFIVIKNDHACITSVTFFPHPRDMWPPYEPNISLDVMCKWEKGKSQYPARLLDRHGRKMKPYASNDKQILVRYPALSCDDAGVISCEAPWSSNNASATLLIKCPPVFPDNSEPQFTLVPGQDIRLSFSVRSHAPLQRCQISHGTDQNECMTRHNLAGNPPDLTLTVRLDKVRKEEEGQWRLELTNDAGTGEKTFSLKITDTDPSSGIANPSIEDTTIGQASLSDLSSSTSAKCENVGDSAYKGFSKPASYATAIVAGFAVVVAVAAAAFVICRLLRNRPGIFPPNQNLNPNYQVRMVGQNIIFQGAGGLLGHGDYGYEEIGAHQRPLARVQDNPQNNQVWADADEPEGAVGGAVDVNIPTEKQSGACEDNGSDIYVPIKDILERKRHDKEEQ